jgi:pimeloyl-ACP methyl ester carboxylesterase
LPPERLRESIVPMGRITFGREDLLPRLGELNAATTLVICGDQDKPRPPGEAREMAELIGCPCVGAGRGAYLQSGKSAVRH